MTIDLALFLGLYLATLGLCWIGWNLGRLARVLEDVYDGVADNVVLDDRGWPVLATDRPEWGEDADTDRG